MRYLALTALTACTLGVVVLVGSSAGGGSQATRPAIAPIVPRGKHRRRYVVHRGDSLSRVAVRTGIPVTQLKHLNPRLDPNALRPGQHIKLVR